MNPSFHPRGRDRQAGFTLVEMLMVMGIMLILGTLSLVAFKSLTSSSALTTSTALISTAFAYARQEAIAKNTYTSVVLMTEAGVPNAYATFSVWEYSISAASWSQITTWKTLPIGIVFDNATAASSPTLSYLSSTVSITTSNTASYITTPQACTPLVANPSTATVAYATIPYLLLGASGTLTYGTAGSAASQQYACQTFMPSGRLYSSGSSPYTLLLVEGVYSTTGNLTYTHVNSSTYGPLNYALFYFNIADGQAKIIRP